MDIKSRPLTVFTNEQDLANMVKNKVAFVAKMGEAKYAELKGKLETAIKEKQETIRLVAPEQGRRLKETRVKAKMTQKELSKVSGISKKEISQIERKTQVFSVLSAKNLAEALKVTPEYLISGDK